MAQLSPTCGLPKSGNITQLDNCGNRYVSLNPMQQAPPCQPRAVHNHHKNAVHDVHHASPRPSHAIVHPLSMSTCLAPDVPCRFEPSEPLPNSQQSCFLTATLHADRISSGSLDDQQMGFQATTYSSAPILGGNPVVIPKPTPALAAQLSPTDAGVAPAALPHGNSSATKAGLGQVRVSVSAVPGRTSTTQLGSWSTACH